MENATDIKQAVKNKYSQIAESKEEGCCSTSCCGGGKETDYSMFNEDYTQIEGYIPDADLNLGCGLPTEHAGIKKGDTVVDLGSGAGNDVFIARAITGEEGRVIGIDMTEAMVEKATENNRKLGYNNVEFKLGDIEEMPLADGTADVVVSNCVLNLVPDKEKAFKEIKRILKPAGHFCVSDIVILGEIPAELRKSAELYAGCVSGALKQEEYLNIISSSGFTNIEVVKVRKIELPDEMIREHVSEEGLKEYRNNMVGIYSITVKGIKSN